MQFVAQVVALAAFYALVAAGFVLIYRSSHILNLAHGELMMLGAYLVFVMAPWWAEFLWGGILLALLSCFLLGYVLYFLLMRPLIGQPIIAAVMVTIAASSILRGLASLIWSPQQRYLGVTLGIRNVPHDVLPGVSLSTYDIATIVTSVVYVGGILLFLKFSRLGIRMRAAAENPLLASQRGINIYAIFALAWSIAIVGAAAAGVLYGGNSRIDPEMGIIGIKALVVPLVGGMDSMWGVIPGALLVALAEFLVSKYIDPGLSEIIPMVIMLLVLIARPWGLFGTKEQIERV